MKKGVIAVTGILCAFLLCLTGCQTTSATQNTEDPMYLTEFAVPQLRELSEAILVLGELEDSIAYCVSEEELRQNYGYYNFQQRMTTIADTIDGYGEDKVPQQYRKLHTAMRDLSASIRAFTMDYPKAAMQKDAGRVTELYQPIYRQWQRVLSYLPQQGKELTVQTDASTTTDTDSLDGEVSAP